MIRVYSAQLPWARQAVRALHRAGIAASLLNEPSPTVRQKSVGTFMVHVGVAPAEVDRARAMLREWQARSERTVAPLVARFRRHVMLSLTPAAILVLCGWRYDRPWMYAAAFPSFLLIAAAIGLWERLKNRRPGAGRRSGGRP